MTILITLTTVFRSLLMVSIFCGDSCARLR